MIAFGLSLKGQRRVEPASYALLLGFLSAAITMMTLPVCLRAQRQTSFPTTVEVHGTVVDAVTGKPLAGAVVTTEAPDRELRFRYSKHSLLPSEPAAAQPAQAKLGPDKQQVTDAQGRFRFPAMEWEEHKDFYISKPGYVAPGSADPVLDSEVAAMPGIDELHFRLAPAAEVKGRVATTNGKVLPHVLVTLYRVGYTLGHPHWSNFDETRTADDGSYRFEDLPPGTYFAVTQWLLDNDPLPWDTTECADGDFQPEGGFAPEAEPGVEDFHKAVPIVLTEGKHAVEDLKLQHHAFHPVTIAYDPALTFGFVTVEDRNGRALKMPVSPHTQCSRELRPKGRRDNATIRLPDGVSRSTNMQPMRWMIRD